MLICVDVLKSLLSELPCVWLAWEHILARSGNPGLRGLRCWQEHSTASGLANVTPAVRGSGLALVDMRLCLRMVSFWDPFRGTYQGNTNEIREAATCFGDLASVLWATLGMLWVATIFHPESLNSGKDWPAHEQPQDSPANAGYPKQCQFFLQ